MAEQELDLEGRRNGGQKDLSDLSAIDILFASFKLMRNHTKLFLLIIVSMVLPVMVIETGFSVLMLPFVIQNSPARNSTLTGGLPRMTLGTFDTSISQDNGRVSNFPYSILVTFVFDMAATLLGSVLSPVAFCPIIYAVACILTNTSVKFSDTVAAMRACWSRTWLTALCVDTIQIPSMLITLAYNLYLSYAIKRNSALLEGIIVYAFVSLLVSLATIIASFMFYLSPLVATVEDKLGWKAMGKAWWLLRSKLWVALGVKFFSFLMALPVAAFAVWWTASSTIPSKQAWLSMATGITPTWVLWALGFALWETVTATIQIVMISVLYISCKAKRGDSLEEERLFTIDVTEKLYTKVGRVESEAE